jgi:hypothetical protein
MFVFGLHKCQYSKFSPYTQIFFFAVQPNIRFPIYPILYWLQAYLHQKDDPTLTWNSSTAINLLLSPAIHVLLPSLATSPIAFYLLATNLQRYKMDYSHIKVIMSYGGEERRIQDFGGET